MITCSKKYAHSVAAIGIALAALLAWTIGCRDSGPLAVTSFDSLPGIVVSAPVPGPVAAPGSVTTPAARSAASAAGETVAYVSMAPGSVLGGLQASIRALASGRSVTTGVVDGGFDPVPLVASDGDTLVVEVTRSGGAAPLHGVETVRAHTPPVVARTDPPPQKVDVPLNAIMVIVFSAPIDSATLNAGSVQLWRDTTPVPGTVRFSDASGFRAELDPNSPLSSRTVYRLVVSQAIRDVNGAALASPVESRFTTGGTVQTAAQLAFLVQPGSATAGGTISPALVVAIQDASGSLVTSASNAVTIALGANLAMGTLFGATTVNAVNGMATFGNVFIDKAGTGYTLAAAATGLTGATSTTFNVTAGAAAKLAITVQPTNTIAGVAITPAVAVTVQDAQGNPVTSANTSITLALGTNAGGGTLAGTATVAAVGGVASFSGLSIDKAGAGYRLAATATGLTGATSATFDVTAGAAAKLAFTVQPTNVFPGALISPAVRVTVQDAGGNTVTSATTSIRLAIGTNAAGGTLFGTFAVAAVSGVATFSNLSIDKAGAGYTLTATATGLTGATSATFNVTGFAATRLAITVQPTNTIAGVAITPAVAVTVEDAQGSPVTSATTSITLAIGTNPGGGTLAGTTTTVAAANGVATFANLSIDKVGTGYTLTATATGLAGATSAAFSVTGAAAKLAFTVQPTNTIAGVAITPWVAVTIQDAQGNTVPSASTSITLAIGTNPGGGTLAGTTTTVAAANGVATFANLSIDKPGTGYTLTVTATGLTGATSTPFGVLPLVPFVAASAGREFTCGLKTAGVAYCWGANWSGQLGTGTTSYGSDVPQAVQGNLQFSMISASGTAAACGLTVSGAAYCWGYNGSGQLGNGTGMDASAPVPVAGGLQFTSLAVGGVHACGLTAAGLAYCWGDNGSGQLGTGTTQFSSIPVRVGGGLLFATLSAGSGHTCAVTAAGAAYCWGSNGYGQLGNGTTSASVTTPVPVAGGLTFASVSAGSAHTCGVIAGGAGFCWGDNSSGQLGTQLTGGNAAVPVAVASGLTFTTIVAGYTQSCAIAVGGAAYCWGDNSSGQLGTGAYVASASPVLVTGGLVFTSLTAGGDVIFGGSSSSGSYVVAHTCGVTTGGLYCWGDNSYGKLGSPYSLPGSTVPVKVVGQP